MYKNKDEKTKTIIANLYKPIPDLYKNIERKNTKIQAKFIQANTQT